MSRSRYWHAGYGAAARGCGPLPAGLSIWSRQEGLAGLTSKATMVAVGTNLVQQLQPLRPYLHVQRDHAREVAARSAEAGDKTSLDRVAAAVEDDRNRRGRRFCCQRCRSATRRTITATWRRTSSAASAGNRSYLALRPAIFDRHVLALDIAGFAQALAERAQTVRGTRPADSPLRNPITGIAGCCARAASGHAAAAPPRSVMNSRRLIRSPRRRARAASAAREAERLGGLEVDRSSYLVGACTGRSAGFSPLRIRST